jgi:antitoxin (DNA-binding transcriptional repressor) of toxin-antitoxin stability system
MRMVSLREFRTRGAKALEKVPKGETVLLSGQKGPAYFLVPAMGDLAAQEDDLQMVIARASLRESWEIAKTLPPITDEEIEQEIRAYRAERAAKEMKKSA